MKKIFTLLAIGVLNLSFCQGVSFEKTSFKEALQKAKKENKILFMDCYTTWCGPCKWMTKEIFPQKEVGDFFNENFISIKIDMEKGEGIALNSEYGVNAYPTLLFIDSSGKEIHKLVGGKKAPDLIEGAKAALNPNTRISSLKEKYNNGNKDHDFLVTYLKALQAESNAANIAIVAKEIIAQSSIEKFMTNDLFFVIAAANFSYGTKEFNYLLNNKENVKALTKDYEYGTVYFRPIFGHLQKYAKECKSLEALHLEIKNSNTLFDISKFRDVKKDLSYDFYIANNELQTWYVNKLKDAEALKGEKQHIYVYYDICDEILRTPKLAASNEIIDNFITIAQNFAADRENGIIMGNIMLAKLYLHKKDKEKAQTSFDIFFEENAKAGGNNNHPSVSNLRKAIENL
ncbi:thioredoxin domain-containing protein [Flavivirga amylovorans]|uniref:Thioredoxin domain-containing protein n=1 Tax=Flavivirga amylovorans TaxID=870486 RepID=A0ABT8X0Y9_9FLAO|nr:thioredoxin domain-containing protein [Flavivirga amylovorans]MDO5987611.1 thioredoxin domain-containing protein [Flavivirga amylovorans]